jgi:DNA-binding NarL/FixJ family response regulator
VFGATHLGPHALALLHGTLEQGGRALQTDQPLRILVADADPFFRRGVREILNEAGDMRVIAEASDGEQAVQSARSLGHAGVDLALIDLELPRLDGLVASERLTSEVPGLAVVILAVAVDLDFLLRAVRAGAVGFIEKRVAPEVLVRAIRTFQRGEGLPLSRAHGEQLLQIVRSATAPRPPPAEDVALLTAREKEVLALVATGARDREIARQLVVGESTVKKHVQNMLRKLKARNRAEAVRIAARQLELE